LHGLQGLHGLFFTAHGLQGLQAAFFTAHGLHGLQAVFFTAHGLQGLHAVLAAQGLHAASRSGWPWVNIFVAAHGLAPFSAVTTTGAATATMPPRTAAESGLRFMGNGALTCFMF
jgi:hypothetical protein